MRGNPDAVYLHVAAQRAWTVGGAQAEIESALLSGRDVDGPLLRDVVRSLYPAAAAVYDATAACYRVLTHADSSDHALGLGRDEAGAWRDAARACVREEAPTLPAAGSPTQSLRSDEALWLANRGDELATRKLTDRQRVQRLYPRAEVRVEARKGRDDTFGVWVGSQSLSLGYATELEAWRAAEENTRPPRRETVGGDK